MEIRCKLRRFQEIVNYTTFAITGMRQMVESGRASPIKYEITYMSKDYMPLGCFMDVHQDFVSLVENPSTDELSSLHPSSTAEITMNVCS